MLLKTNDFIPNSKVTFEGLHEETFVRKTNSNMFIHILTLGFMGGHFEEFYFIRDKRCSFDSVMKQISDIKSTKYPSFEMKKYLKTLGEIISGELSDIIAVDSYMVYIQREEKVSG